MTFIDDEDREDREERIARWHEAKAESRELLDEVDRVLATRHAPLTNVIPMVRKPPPEPEPKPQRLDTPVQALIQQAAADLRATLAKQREESIELADSIIDDIRSLHDQVVSLQGDVGDIRRKTIEGDITSLQDRIARIEANQERLEANQERLISEIQGLRDDFASIERSAKVVALRGSA